MANHVLQHVAPGGEMLLASGLVTGRSRPRCAIPQFEMPHLRLPRHVRLRTPRKCTRERPRVYVRRVTNVEMRSLDELFLATRKRTVEAHHYLVPLDVR